MTKELHNCTFDKFCTNLFKFRKPGEYFDIHQIQEYLLLDNNHVSDKQALQYINDLIKSGEILAVNEKLGIYQVIKNKGVFQKKDDILYITYEGFCEVISGWKLKGEMITVRELRTRLNRMNIFLKYFLIHEYMYKMVEENKVIRYSRFRYQML